MSRALPPAAAGFRWHDESSTPVLRCEPLAAIARHAFTSRQLRLRGADPAAWSRVAALVSCPVTALHRVRQVHGAVVAVVDAAAAGPSRPEADALITRVPGAALAVVTADCVPVLLADPVSGAVGAVHAGWRGTAANIAGAAVAAMADRWGVPPARLTAAIGPSIGACCYEVGDELEGAFVAAGHDARALAAWFRRDDRGRLRLDLWTANRDLLVAAGLRPEQVHVAGLCTKTHLQWFESYRAEGPNAGRMAAIIVSPD
ncbi:MAG: peptidoglycan editing factor PgeF [Vicinamibacterales bacterium]